MRGLDVLGLWAVLATSVCGLAYPFTPYVGSHFDRTQGDKASAPGVKLALKRSPTPTDVHPEIARVQALNRAFKKFAKRLDSPVKRDAYAEILAKHNDLVERGEFPGTGHFLQRRQNDIATTFLESVSEADSSGFLPGNPPTISPAVALDEDGQDIVYFSAIGIGNKQKQFLVIMDTGSSDLWVPAQSCKSLSCEDHSTLGSNDSATLKQTKQPWQIQYGSGSASGVIVSDSLSIAGLTVKSMPFGVATTVSDDFAGSPPDGILGLALSKANAQGVPTVMDQLKSNNVIPRKLIGVNLQRAADKNSDGEISFGVVDTAKFHGSLSVVPNVGTIGLWEVPIDDVSVNGARLQFQGKTSITDTGTTLMLIPPNDALTLHNAIPGSVTDGQGDFGFPCSTNANIAMIFSGKSFTISPKDYVGPPLNGTGDLCQSNIVGAQIGSPDQWLVGDVFLKNVYTVFDYDNNRIGFGAKAATQNTTTLVVSSQSFVAMSGSWNPMSALAKQALMYGLGSMFLSMVLFF